MGMRKIAIFTEGQTELFFVKYLLLNVLNIEKISLECFYLHRERTSPYGYYYDCKNDNAEIYFMIFDIKGDTKLLSAIKDREKGLFEAKYEKIIGLRDMFSEEYRRLSGTIDARINEQFISGFYETIGRMSDPSRISLFVAIMEIEAWFLSMYKIFKKIDTRITPEFIKSHEICDLINDDPETNQKFFHPTQRMKEIYSLVNMEYDKKRFCAENFTRNIDIEIVREALGSNKCSKLRDFLREIIEVAGDYCSI
jgi:hypothetical protein